MFDEKQCKTLVEQIFACAAGSDECEVVVHSGDQALTRFGRNAISQNTAKSTVSVDIRLVIDDREGKVTVNQAAPTFVDAAVQRARKIAQLQPPTPDRLKMVGKSSAEPTEYRQTPAFDAQTAAVGPEQRAAVVKTIVDRAAPRSLQTSGICETAGGALAYANTNGIFAFHPSTSATLSATAQTSDSAGWAIHYGPRFAGLDAQQVADVAVQKAESSRDPKPLPLGVHTVILEPAAVAELLRFLCFLGFAGLGHLEGRSFCSGRLGERFFDEKLTIIDDPWHELAPGMPFDFEGIAKREMTFTDAGRVVAVAHDRTTARAASTESTGHAMPQPNTSGGVPSNLRIVAGAVSLEEMIAETPSGVLVTKFHYLNAENPKALKITGLTRNGTYRIADGKIAEPVVNMRFTESLLAAFGPGNIAHVGRDLVATKAFFGGAFVVPAIKLHKFAFSSHTGF